MSDPSLNHPPSARDAARTHARACGGVNSDGFAAEDAARGQHIIIAAITERDALMPLGA